MNWSHKHCLNKGSISHELNESGIENIIDLFWRQLMNDLEDKDDLVPSLLDNKNWLVE